MCASRPARRSAGATTPTRDEGRPLRLGDTAIAELRLTGIDRPPTAVQTLSGRPPADLATRRPAAKLPRAAKIAHADRGGVDVAV